MSNLIIAKRYAEALFQLGLEHNNMEALANELKVVAEVFKKESQFESLLLHPQVVTSDKERLIQNVFGNLSEQVLHTLLLLIRRGRISFLPEIIHSFLDRVEQERGVASIKVYTVTALSEEQKDLIIASFKERLNKQQIEIENVIDGSIIGGMRIRYGNTVFDGTVLSKLKRLERSIRAVNY